jgi:DNA-binding GntR family transcriptional regulator
MMQYVSLKECVYDYISEKINDGSLKPYDKINEQQISDALNVSRTPVREALIQMAADGYLENMPRKGFRVKPLDHDRACNLYEVIGILDGRIAYKAVDLINDEHIKQMQYFADAMDAAIEQGLSSEYYKHQINFHEVYTNLYKNEVMTSTLNKMKNQFMRKYYKFDDLESELKILKRTNMEHHKIVALFKEKKKDELERYIRDVHWSTENAMFDSF